MLNFLGSFAFKSAAWSPSSRQQHHLCTVELELWLFCSSLHGLLRYIIHLIYTLHCPRNNLNVRTKTEPVCTVEADVKRLLVSYVRVYLAQKQDIQYTRTVYHCLFSSHDRFEVFSYRDFFWGQCTISHLRYVKDMNYQHTILYCT